jgi:arylsulfatase
MEFKYDGGGIAKGGAVALFINDKKVGEGRIDKTEPVRFSANETFDTALDSAFSGQH